MIERIIDWCVSNRFLVFTGTVVLTLWGIWAMTKTPLDAVPDISDVQVIVSTEWMGRSPDLIEDQITYPIVSALISTPHVKAVRGFTDFGISYVYVIFQDGTDIYWARSRVVEYLQGIRGQLPEGTNPVIGPDATGVGWVFEYALVDETGQHNLAELRGFQDWYWRYWLASIPGVAEVASLGGFVKRFGENAVRVIDQVKAKLREVQSSMPAGVKIVPTYDRSWLIGESINTLRRTLIEESIVVSLVILIFLFHVRSALIPILTLPIAVVASFIPMYYLDVTSNIMSLGGLALAIGVLVDASIVMVENAYRLVSEEQTPYEDQPRAIVQAAKQVARPIFFSLAIIVISFVPVFLLEAQEGRMFRPLAFTKTFAMIAASILSITLVPVLMMIFIRGRRLRPEAANPLSRAFTAIYRPILA